MFLPKFTLWSYPSLQPGLFIPDITEQIGTTILRHINLIMSIPCMPSADNALGKIKEKKKKLEHETTREESLAYCLQ